MTKYVFDTSSLIEMYKVNINFHKLIVEKMKKLDTYYSQVVAEELKGCELITDIYLPEKSFDNHLGTINKIKKKLQSLQEVSDEKQMGIKNISEQLKLINKINLEKITEEYNKEIEKLNDEKREYIKSTEYPCKTIDFSIKDRLTYLSDAEARFRNSIPPGYKDEGKKSKKLLRKFNDYYIWQSMINYFKDMPNQSVTYVTNDKKDSYEKEWDREFLMEEFKSETGNSIEFINSKQFLERIGYKNKFSTLYKEKLREKIEKECYKEITYGELSSRIYHSGVMKEDYTILDISMEMQDYHIEIHKVSVKVDVVVSGQFDYSTTHNEYGNGEFIKNIYLEYVIDTLTEEISEELREEDVEYIILFEDYKGTVSIDSYCRICEIDFTTDFIEGSGLQDAICPSCGTISDHYEI